MRRVVGIALAGACCAVIGLGIWKAIGDRDRPVNQAPNVVGPARADRAAPTDGRENSTGDTASPNIETFPDPNAPGTTARIFANPSYFDAEIFTAAIPYTGEITDYNAMSELRAAIRGRAGRGLAALRVQYDPRQLDSPTSTNLADKAIRLQRLIAFLYMHDGQLAEAASWLERALELSERRGASANDRASLRALLGITALRRGEIENCLGCVGPSSCIFPIASEAAHIKQSGSREAVKQLTAALELTPGDLRIRWLLNLVYMTLNEYPGKVPRAYLIPLDSFRSTLEVGRFENVAPRAGLGARGPNQAGGSIFDDFNGDDLPDLFSTSIDGDLGASLFINSGDGTFEDRTTAGLKEQVYVLNVARADFDNDGNPDVLLMRGAGRSQLDSPCFGIREAVYSRT